MIKWLRGLALLALVPFSPLEAQRAVNIHVTLPVEASRSREAPLITAGAFLTGSDEERLIRKGFPAQLRYNAELWAASGVFGRALSNASWRVIVDYDPLDRTFGIVRYAADEGYQSLGSHKSFADVKALISRPMQPRIRPPAQPGRYYYSVTLEVERMAENDLAEMRSWLGTAVGSDRNAGSAVIGFLGSLVKRLVGAQKRIYQGRSEVFDVR